MVLNKISYDSTNIMNVKLTSDNNEVDYREHLKIRGYVFKVQSTMIISLVYPFCYYKVLLYECRCNSGCVNSRCYTQSSKTIKIPSIKYVLMLLMYQ